MPQIISHAVADFLPVVLQVLRGIESHKIKENQRKIKKIKGARVELNSHGR